MAQCDNAGYRVLKLLAVLAAGPFGSGLMSELERLRIAANDAEERFSALLQTVVDGVVIIDERGVIKTFNPAAERIFGYAAEEALDQNVSLLMPEPDRGQHDRYIGSYLRTGVAKIIGIGREVAGRRKDGATFPMDLSIGEMIDGERYFVATIRDLTERKAMESQLLQASKMEAIGRLTGGIAHDFNNQLAVLMMDLELLSEIAGDSEEMSELINESREAARSAADLTQRLLTISRRQFLAPSVIDLGALVEETTGLLRRTLGERIRVDTFTQNDLWPAKVDRAQLENALLNLAVNARDAMSDGGSLEIETSNVTVLDPHDTPEPGDYVRLTIRDDGSGMPPDVIEHVFEPFFTTKESGTGLGLSMVYGFVKQSGGEVVIDSRQGVGTAVHLYLPRSEVVTEATKTPARARPIPRGSETVVLVEDYEPLRKRTASQLRRLGYQVVEFPNGTAASDWIEGDPAFDLVLTDVVMPGTIDGPALIGRVRARRADARILMMTGYAEAREPVEALRADGVALLEKPFTNEVLAQAVRDALDGRARGHTTGPNTGRGG